MQVQIKWLFDAADRISVKDSGRVGRWPLLQRLYICPYDIALLFIINKTKYKLR